MCVGLSAKVVSVNEGTAVIDASGAKREVSADLIDDLEVGDGALDVPIEVTRLELSGICVDQHCADTQMRSQ